mmetsp:Transcript_37056/g.80986  ORF Transcript_37056/g.80986 Transcript_37056/m.80986 type:complete len:83 (-) Transcript_37056:103-351(-)
MRPFAREEGAATPDVPREGRDRQRHSGHVVCVPSQRRAKPDVLLRESEESGGPDCELGQLVPGAPRVRAPAVSGVSSRATAA